MVNITNEDSNDETGVFNKVPLRGKDFILDNIIKENRDELLNIQIDMETVFLNGDIEKARSNILKSKFCLFY